MSNTIIIVKNQIAATLPFTQLSVPDAELVGFAQVTLTDWNTITGIQSDPQLLGYIQDGYIILNVNGSDLTQAQSVNIATSPTSTAEAALIISGEGFSLDNAIARWNGVDGYTIQNSAVTIDDSGNIVSVGTVDGVTVSAHGSRHNPGAIDAVSTAAPVAISVGASPSEGSAASVSRSDHQHGVASGAPSSVSKSANSEGSASTVSRTDHKHDITTAAPGATGVATASAEGSATTIARSDHTHQSNTAPATTTKAAAAIGTSGEPARADHKHDVSTAAPGATGVATASAEGSATSLARSDHAHQSNTAPANVTKATAAIGTSGEPARADHKHDITTSAPTVGIGGSNSEGTSTSLARADHNHAIRTTSGPTDLTVGAVLDGYLLQRSGTSLVGITRPGVDTTAIHRTLSAEISSLTEKTVPGFGDWVIIEDGYTSFSKKKVSVGKLITGGIREIFLPPLSSSPSTSGDHIGASVATNGNTTIEFNIPSDFTTIITMNAIIIPGSTVGAADIDLNSDYGALGESAQFHSESNTTITYSWTANQITALAVGSVFTSAAAGDICGLNLKNNSVSGGYTILGVRLRYQ